MSSKISKTGNKNKVVAFEVKKIKIIYKSG